MIGKQTLHLISVVLGIDEPITQTTKAEQAVIEKHCVGKLLAVEIGVFEGQNTSLIAASISNLGIVYGVDPFFKNKLGIQCGKIIAEVILKRRKLSRKVEFIQQMSHLAISQIPKNLDFIFIDGDHSFEAVKNDFDLYSNNLSPNGVVALHDSRLFEGGWTNTNQGPVRLLNEIILPSNQWEVIDEVDSLVIVKRIIN